MSKDLRTIVEMFDCTSGTLHRKEGETLYLEDHVGIPDPVLGRIEAVPIGKGMAGIAAERKEPVDVCNLQTDLGGVAEDGARETGMQGSLAAPIIHDGIVRGTIGVAKPEEHEFTPEEREQLMDAAEDL